MWSSDHCPFRYDDARGKPAGVLDYEAGLSGQPVPALSKEDLSTTLKGKIGSFKLIPNGIPGLETRLPLLYTSGVQTGRISIQKFVELTATNPARIVRPPFPLLSSPLALAPNGISTACIPRKERSHRGLTQTLSS